MFRGGIIDILGERMFNMELPNNRKRDCTEKFCVWWRYEEMTCLQRYVIFLTEENAEGGMCTDGPLWWPIKGTVDQIRSCISAEAQRFRPAFVEWVEMRCEWWHLLLKTVLQVNTAIPQHQYEWSQGCGEVTVGSHHMGPQLKSLSFSLNWGPVAYFCRATHYSSLSFIFCSLILVEQLWMSHCSLSSLLSYTGPWFCLSGYHSLKQPALVPIPSSLRCCSFDWLHFTNWRSDEYLDETERLRDLFILNLSKRRGSILNVFSIIFTFWRKEILSCLCFLTHRTVCL